MADIPVIIEAQELRFMQSWMHRDAGAIRSLAARDFMMMVGTNPPQLLDRPSFIAAMERGFTCAGFRLGESFVRRHGRSAWYVAAAKLDLQLGGRKWAGEFLLSDMWYKHRISGWKLVERSLSRADNDESFAGSVRKLQLWT